VNIRRSDMGKSIVRFPQIRPRGFLENMTYCYKRLTNFDTQLFKQLLTVSAEAFDEPEVYQNKVPSDIYLRNLLAIEDFLVLVALDRNLVVGGLTAHVLRKFEQERKEIYI
jgi:aminoglycoside 3-N-acetyltransferase I